jgi:gluconate 2-dehydrogenase gamma chain
VPDPLRTISMKAVQIMSDSTQSKPRRDFLLKSLVTTAGAAAAAALPMAASAAQANLATAQGGTTPAPVPVAAQAAGYEWLRPDEQSFVEALVDHMVPADQYSPKGTDMGINIYFDRTLGGAWGQGERLYIQGPFKKGTPNQGYQLGMVPAALFRAGAEGLKDYCVAKYQKSFDVLSAAAKEEVLKGLQGGQIELPNGVPARTFFAQLYQLVQEGMYADPIYGGNRNKSGWKMIGYPGVIQTNKVNIVKFKNKPYKVDPKSIADLS